MNISRLFSGPMSTFVIFAVCACAYLPLKGDSQPDYFSHSKLYSAEELAQTLKTKTLDMCWGFGTDSHLRFVSGNDEIYFEVYLGRLPDQYNDFLTRIKARCIEDTNAGKLVFAYRVSNDGKEEINIPQPSSAKGHPDEYSYIVTDRRIIEDAGPQSMNENELTTIIRDKNVLFYTGAGLSLASEVPAMNELNQLLGLEANERFIFSLEKALENPREFASKIEVFHKACLFSPPTQAHLALKELAIFKDIRIVTENLDCLHEASGIYPYRINPHQLRDEIGGGSLSQFDYIICVGLSYDDRGFLGWYKQQNPQGKIIALDLYEPSYLGDEDFLVTGDIQEVIPRIQKAITQ